MTRTITLCALMSLLALRATGAQAISTTSVERDPQRDAYWRVTYDNDFFTATDRYYTQGIHVEVVHPDLRKFVPTRALIHPNGSQTRFGIAYEDDGYTASDLKLPQILIGDHPYAGTKQLRLFAIASDSARDTRLSSAITLGIIGPGAAGGEIQTFIHKRTGNTLPQGWHNQIRNDIILNYEATIERPIAQVGSHLLIVGIGTARLGTYSTALSGGTSLIVGRVGNMFNATQANPRGRTFYAYAKPQLQFVGYDATLQGGLFNRSSPYTIASRDVARAVYRQQVGLVYRSGSRYIEYFHSVASPEFRGARSHKTGGLLFGMTI
jgi:lipid A 3-O-deacylase